MEIERDVWERERKRGERSWNEIVGISMVKIVGMTRGREELRIIKRVFKIVLLPFLFGDLYGEINRKF